MIQISEHELILDQNRKLCHYDYAETVLFHKISTAEN